MMKSLHEQLLAKSKWLICVVALGAALAISSCGSSLTVYSFANSRFAFVDKKGNLIYWPKKIEAVTGFHEGSAVFHRPATKDEPSYSGFIGLDQVLHPLPYWFDNKSYLSNGLALVRNPKTRKFCYINEHGEIKIGETVLKAYVDACRPFSDGLAAVFVPSKSARKQPPSPNVIRDGLWGFIDKTGHLAIPAKFSSVSDFCSDRALVTLPDAPKRIIVINTAGQVVFRNMHDTLGEFSEDGFAIFRNKKTNGGIDRSHSGLVDRDGNVSAEGFWFINFNNGLGLLEDNREAQSLVYADAKGRTCLKLSKKQVVTYWFNDGPSFSDGLAQMVIGRYPQSTGKKRDLYAQKVFGFIDKKGKQVPIQTHGKVITSVHPYSDGYAIVELQDMTSKKVDVWP